MTKFLREPRWGVRRRVVVATLVVVVGGGALFRVLGHREYHTIWTGMWLALQTVTTVGYGDVAPKNAAGKIVAALIMLEGIAFLAIVTAAITSTFVARARKRLETAEGAEELRQPDRRTLRRPRRATEPGRVDGRPPSRSNPDPSGNKRHRPSLARFERRHRSPHGREEAL